MNAAIKLLTAVGTAVVLAATGCAVSTDDGGDSEPLSEEEEWNNAYDEHGGGKFDTPGCSGVLLPDQSGFERRVALTFDDGPSTALTPQVLDILAAHDVKATFFVNGSKASGDAQRQILQRMLAEGHIVGSHGWDHANHKSVSAADLDRLVRLNHEFITGLGETRLFYRFPYGAAGCSTVEHAESYGYAVTGWHIDTADWCFANSRGGVGYCSPETFRHVPDSYRNDMVGLTLSQVRSKNGGVVLFHDVHANTVNHLDEIIRTLKADGFTFTNLDDENTFPLLNGLTPPFVGHACGGDADCEFSASGHDGECLLYSDGGTERGFCTVACDGYCPDRPGDAPTFCVSLDGGQSGSCVSKSAVENEYCGALPGTRAVDMDRYIGSSSAPPSTATVCVP